MKKVSDILAHRLANAGVKTFYGVQGGACMHLIESICQNNETQYLPVLNEQSAGLSAHGHYFASGQPAGAIVTTGPGFFNAVTGIAACYYDNVPAVFLCGQVGSGLNLAQKFGTKMYGFQEAPHAEISELISEQSLKVRNEDEFLQAISVIDELSVGNVQGPVVLEIQDDFQRQMLAIDDKIDNGKNTSQGDLASSSERSVTTIINALEEAKRPLLLVGGGIDIHSEKMLETLNPVLDHLDIPAVFTWGGQRLLQSDNPLHIGLFGTHCPGTGNAAVQSCDLLISLGASLLQHQVGKAKDIFAPNAKIIAVNSSENEGKRLSHDFGERITVLPDDTTQLLTELRKQLETNSINAVNHQKRVFNARSEVQDALKEQAPVKTLIRFLETCPSDHMVFSDAGATLSWTYQAASLCHAPHITTSFNLHTMGYSIPAAIGAASSPDCKGVLAISGDGGMMMNIQELAVAKCLGIPIKVLIIDNLGYGIIRQTQNAFLDRRHFGSDIGMTPSLPSYDLRQIFEAFGFEAYATDHQNAETAANWLFESGSPHRVAIVSIDVDEEVEGTTPNNAPLVF